MITTSAPARALLPTTKGTLSSLLTINPEVLALWSLADEGKLVFAIHILGVSDFNPVLLLREPSAWSAISFSGDLHGHAWQEVVYIPKTKTIMGILDFGVESPGGQLEILASRDGGKTWSQSTVEKPYYLSQLLHAEVFADGAVRLSVTLEDDYGSGNKPGLYQYMSTDQGATWSAPTFSATLPTAGRKTSLSKNIKAEAELDALFP